MRKLITMILIVIAGVNIGYAQMILSNGTGGGLWSSPSTWDGGVVPGPGNDVVIQGTDSVMFAGGDGCNNLTVSSGGKLAASAGPFSVNGVFTLEADAWYYNQISDVSSCPGTERMLDPASTYVHSGSSSVGGEGNLEFGNVIVQKTSGSTAGGDLIIHGNLTINNGASNQYFRGVNASSGSHTHLVEGNVYIVRGTMSGVDVGATPQDYCVWNIEGDVIVAGAAVNDARLGAFSSASAMGTSIFNIKGNVVITGGRFQAGSSSTVSTGTGIFNLYKNFTLDETSSVSTSTHGGPFAVNFVGSGNQRFTVKRNVNWNFSVSDTVGANSKLTVDLVDSSWASSASDAAFVVNGSVEFTGNSNIAGNGTFTVAPGGTLIITEAGGLADTGSTGNIRVAGARTFSEEGNYEFKGTSWQNTGKGLPSTVKGLTVNNTEGLILFKDYTVTGSLKVVQGDLDMDSHTLTIGSEGTLTESAGNTVRGNGSLVTAAALNAPNAVNVGGLGLTITSAANLGQTTIERKWHSVGINPGIVREYKVTPANNTGLNAALRVSYDESELNSLSEDQLVVYTSATGNDGDWQKAGGTVNTANNYVEVTGINELAYITLGSSGTPLDVETAGKLPAEYALYRNYPNPFNPSTTISFALPEAAYVDITVYNMLGEKVASVLQGQMNAGYQHVNFNASGLASGIYIYKMTAAGNKGVTAFSQKMMLMK